jgi:YD repeat-containing protein
MREARDEADRATEHALRLKATAALMADPQDVAALAAKVEQVAVEADNAYLLALMGVEDRRGVTFEYDGNGRISSITQPAAP